MQYTCRLFGAKSPICENQLRRSNKRIQLSFCLTNRRNCFSKSNIQLEGPWKWTIYSINATKFITIFICSSTRTSSSRFFVYMSSLRPSLHSVNRQRALHKMNTRFQFGTVSSMHWYTVLESWESMKGESSRLGRADAQSFFSFFFPSDVFFLSFPFKKLLGASHL